MLISERCVLYESFIRSLHFPNISPKPTPDAKINASAQTGHSDLSPTSVLSFRKYQYEMHSRANALPPRT